MNTRMILPATIAAGLHALLLSWRSAPSPPPALAVVEDSITEWTFQPPPPDDPPPIDVEPTEIEEIKPPPPDVSHGAEVPVEISRADFQMLRPPAPRVDAPSMKIIPQDIRSDDGTVGPPIYRVIDLQNNPTALVRPAPQPPRDARDRSETVTVEFVVGPDGRVVNAQVVDTSNARFDEACVRAATRWRFEAGLRHGVPVAFRVRQTFVFNPGE